MHVDQPQLSQTDQARPSYAHAAAKASWAACVIVLLLIGFGRAGAVVIVELLAFGLLLVAVVSGIVALTGIRKYGCKGILAPALVGLIMAGLLLFIGTTNFVTARARQIVLRKSAQSTTTRAILPYLAKYAKNGVRFTYDGRYTISRTEREIRLKHTESEVLIYPYSEGMAVDEQLKYYADQARVLLEANNMTGIKETAIEQLPGTTVSAAKLQLTYNAPHGRLVTDIVTISSETNSVALVHVYAQSRPALATNMFETVLNSFLN